jgi:hypothetical protein
LLFFLLVSNIFCFFWLSIFEHVFFSYFISCGNININHIHIYNDCLYLNNMLYLYYCPKCPKCPMKHFLHFNKLWRICHFMSIQTTYVTCIWRCLLCFLTSLCCFYGRHHGLFFIFSTCLHIMICHPIICAMFINLPCILCVFVGAACLVFYGTDNALLVSIVIIPFSHNITASLCYYNVDHFILAIIIMKYDCKLALNIVVRKLSMVDICKPWANFWIRSQ